MSSKSTNPTAEQQIPGFLKQNGKSTVHEIATGIGYSNGHVRRVAKRMAKSGQIEGEKSSSVPAYDIKGDYVVLPDDKDRLLKIVKAYARSHYTNVKGMPMTEIRDYINANIANGVVDSIGRWEFWVDPETTATE